MALFSGTTAGDIVTPYEVSPGVSANPVGSHPGDGDDVIDGGAGDDVLDGGDGTDTVYGRDGNDVLEAFFDWEDGYDILIGGSGNDSYLVHSVWVELYEDLGGGIDTVSSDVSWTLGENFENLRIGESESEILIVADSATGNALNNILWGNHGPNEINGLAGRDTLYGGGGDDRMDGGIGADTMRGERENDQYIVDNTGDRVIEASSSGSDTVYSTISYTLGSNVESLHLTGSANVNATGNSLPNQLAGNSYANTLRGMAGADTLLSGNGRDMVIGGAGNDVFRYLSPVGSSPSARDILRAGDGAAAFERAGSTLGDRFDFTEIDANETVNGLQQFTLGSAKTIGRLWAENSGSLTLIRGNTDADAAPEIEIAVEDGSGVTASAYNIADFILV